MSLSHLAGWQQHSRQFHRTFTTGSPGKLASPAIATSNLQVLASSLTTQERNPLKAMQTSYNGLELPKDGQAIEYRNGNFEVPDHPIIPFIEGDGTGRDIWKASQRVFDAAVEKAYGGKRAIRWFEIFAGEKAFRQFSTWLPDDSVAAARDLRISIKGPLTTPVGGGIRSLNVALRQLLDLYACVRPVKYYQGVPSPVKHPEKVDIVIFRENTEDVYSGIEFKQGSKDVARLIEFINEDLLKGGQKKIRSDSGVGIKPISIFGTKRLVRYALKSALETGRKTVTLVHKGNIQKFTEGAFREWGYEVAENPTLALSYGLCAKFLGCHFIAPLAKRALSEFLNIALVYQGDGLAASLKRTLDRVAHEALGAEDRNRLDTHA